MESIADLNRRLKDYFGETENHPNYRIIWSEDEYEMRSTMYTDEGVALLHSEVRMLPKYKFYVRNRYILERLTEIPYINMKELPATKLSYEPLWVFEDPRSMDKPVYPTWPGIKFVIDIRNENVEKAGFYTKYKELTAEQSIEEREKRIKEVEDSLFGNETPVGDALAHKYGVSLSGIKSVEETLKEGE